MTGAVVRYFHNEGIVYRARAAGDAPLESYAVRTQRWVDAGETVGDVEFIRSISAEEAAQKLRATGLSPTAVRKAVEG